MLSKEKDYYDGPYKQMPFVGGRALPIQVVVQIRPDGTLKFRICRDGGWLKDGDAPNECIDMDAQPALILVRIQDIAQAGAIMKSSGSRVWFWVIDLVGAYRQLTKAQCDIHKQVFLWYNVESGDMEFWVDLRCYFGDRIMVHKFSRIANFVVFCVLEEIAEREDHRSPREHNLQQWLAERKAKLGPEQAVLTYCAMYIDDLSGISVGENDTRARQDYASAVHVIEDVIGLTAQLEHGKESPPTETTVDLLGATFNIPASDLDASDRFKGKATTKLRQSRDEGQWNLVGCESVTYTCNHAAQLSITEGRAHLHHFFVEMRRLRRNSGRKQRISRVCMEEIEWWIAELPKVRHVPWAPALYFPERGHPRRVDPEMDASGNIGFGAACPLPGGIVLFFYGKWTQQELALHINEKEALTSYWALVLFGNVTPTFCANMRYTRVYANERIDNTVAISVGHKNSGKSWRLTKLAQKRAEAARFNGWICSQEYIYTKDNDLSDPLSRDDVELFRRNAYKRGLTIMIHVELDETVRDTSFLFEVVSHDTHNAKTRQTTHASHTTRQHNTNNRHTHPDAPRTPHAATTGPTPLRRCLIEDDNDDDGDTNDIDIVGGADIIDIDSSVHEALMRRTNDNSKPAYMRLWRYWCVFNVLVLNLDLRSVWRSYDGLPDTATKRRDERDLMRFATWLCRRFKRSATAAQGVSMVRSTHRARAGTDIIGLGHGHQLSGCLKGLADLFPSVPRDRFPVTVSMFKQWATMYEWRSKALVNQWCCLLLMYQALLRAAEALCTCPKSFSQDIDMTRHNVQFHPPGADPPRYCIVSIIVKKTNGNGSDKHSKRTPLHLPYHPTNVVNVCRELWHMYKTGDPVAKEKERSTPLFRDPNTGKPISYTHMLSLLRLLLSKLEGIPNPNLYALHSARIGGTSAAMKSKCPQHITQALGRWGGDSLELYERVDIEDSLHWFAMIGETDVNPAEISRLVVQQDLPDPKEDEAESAIETELRAFATEAGG